jgi:hypothetical protein
MDKIILSDGTNLEFEKSDGLNITIENRTFEELEALLTDGSIVVKFEETATAL